MARISKKNAKAATVATAEAVADVEIREVAEASADAAVALPAPEAPAETAPVEAAEPVAANGETVSIPLNRLKKSPRNARKTPHTEAEIEAYAASIAAKGMFQNLVVEPELDGDGKPTGSISSASAKAAGWRSCCALSARRSTRRSRSASSSTR